MKKRGKVGDKCPKHSPAGERCIQKVWETTGVD